MESRELCLLILDENTADDCYNKNKLFLLDQNRDANKNLINVWDSQQNLFTVVSASIKLETISNNQITWMLLYLKFSEEI